MGGDNSPGKTLQGVKIFLDKNQGKDDFVINLFGDEKKLPMKSKLIKFSLMKIFHTENVVSDNETPLTAVKNSKNTSMWKCISHQIEGDADISLSAGNTGTASNIKNDER